MMKALLLSLISITVASSSNVRGAIDESIKHKLLTMPDASCLQLSYRTPDVCEHNKSSDGINKCVWCQTKHDGGVCLSPDNAKDALEIMDVSCPNYTNNLLDDRAHDERSTAVVTPPDFNCFHSTWDKENAESTCKESRDKSNSPCVWCPMSGSEGGNAGACLSNNEAIMTNGKFGLTCPLNIYIEPAKKKVETDIPDLNCFGNAWNALNAETACGQSMDRMAKLAFGANTMKIRWVFVCQGLRRVWPMDNLGSNAQALCRQVESTNKIFGIEQRSSCINRTWM